MKMKRKIWSYSLIALVAIATSCKDDDDNNNNMVEGKNKTTVQEITYSNNAEVELGQLAGTKADASTVKSFGLQMVQDHQKAQNDLDTIANKRNFSKVTGLKQDAQDLKARLNGLSGHSFDTAYINSQRMMHMKTRDMLIAFADTSNDTGLKNYINRTLPVVLIHLHVADSIANTW